MDGTEAQGVPAYAIDSVDKALQVLMLVRERQHLRVVDVSEELGVARSTAHRLLSTLVHRGFVGRDPLTRTYHCGPELLGPGTAATSSADVRDVAHEHMEALSAKLRESVNLTVLEGPYSRFIHGISGDRPLLTSVRIGALLPAQATSGGKALLAELSSQQVRAVFPRGLRRMTEATIVDFKHLEQELRVVRESGYAVNAGESELGLNAVAVAIRQGGRAVAALAISTPTVRMTPEQLPTLVKALRRASQRVEAALG